MMNLHKHSDTIITLLQPELLKKGGNIMLHKQIWWKDSELSKPACKHISSHGTTVDYGSKKKFVLWFVLKKRVVEEDWPQQHIEGIASHGGSQRRDTQSQGLQALHIHKIRESRNKSIQKPLRRRFLLTLIRLWSDNLTESLHPCFTFRIVFKAKVEFFDGWEN